MAITRCVNVKNGIDDMTDTTVIDNPENEQVSEELSNESEQAVEQETVVEQSTTDVPDWVGTTFDPFSTSPEGEDPRYGDSFVAIKQEIDKLADTDYQLVIDEAISVLSKEAKDLRVAGYLILGLAYLEGVKGLIIGLNVYVQLLENYFESSFPQKINAKITAISWLNNNKLLFFIESKEDEVEAYQMEEVATLISNLNRLVKDGFSGHVDVVAPEFTILNSWLEKLKKIAAVKKQQEETKQKAKIAAASGASNSGNSSTGLATASLGAIQSDKDVVNAISALAKHLIANEQYIQAIGVNRAINWSAASLPINDNGKTRLPAPRKAGVNTIRQLIAKGDHKSAFTQCEAMMFEPGANFLLDLQFLASTATKNMHREDISNVIALNTFMLLQRLPGIENLKFDDETPFVQADTKMWLDEVNSMGSGGTSLQLELDEALDKTITEARSVAESKNLQEGLAVFANYNAYTEKQRFKMKLQMAIMCLEDNRPEMALPVLDDLYDKAELCSLAVWDSTLHIFLLKSIQNAIRALIVTSSEDDKVLFETRLVQISNQICKTDIQQALSVL